MERVGHRSGYTRYLPVNGRLQVLNLAISQIGKWGPTMVVMKVQIGYNNSFVGAPRQQIVLLFVLGSHCCVFYLGLIPQPVVPVW